MQNVNAILMFYHHPVKTDAPTIKEHVNAFSHLSRFKIWKINTALGFPTALNNFKFKIIVLHYSLFGHPISLGKPFLSYLGSVKNSYKIAFFQDEHEYWSERVAFINRFALNCVYSLFEPHYFDATYRQYTKVPKIIYNLTGYVSDQLIDFANQCLKPYNDRTIDIGYRARKLPYYLGRGAQEKAFIGEEFKRRVKNLDLTIDIETDEASRIYGEAWYRFLAECKAVLGVEAGTSVIDFDDVLRTQYAALCTGPPEISFPECSFEVFHDRYLKPYEDKIFYRTISPRHFEAAAFRICQILFEGKYSGILKPMEHYIPLKKDFSNFDDVAKMLRDQQLCSEIVDNAYRDLIESGAYSYEKFIQQFDELLMAEGFSTEIDAEDYRMVSAQLERGKLRMQLYMLISGFRELQFPGRRFFKPILKPILKLLGI